MKNEQCKINVDVLPEFVADDTIFTIRVCMDVCIGCAGMR